MEAVSLSCLLLLGVAETAGFVSFVRDGVPARRSKRPRTRPSFCGVGPIDVGTTGLKRVRLMEGVARPAEGAGDRTGRVWEWDLLGV